MADFTRPTLTEILDSIQSDIDSRLTEADATLRNSVLEVIAYVFAGVANGQYGFISWLALQIFPDTAESEYLRRWAAFWGITPIAATPATGNLTVTGTSNGTTIPLGTEFQRSDGALFTSTAEATIASLTAAVPVEANVAGLSSNTAAAASMTFVSPISTIDSTCVVDGSALTGGADDEVDSSILERLLDRVQTPPQGGSSSDYIKWTLEVSGVTRAWVYPLELGVGALSVRFMMDDTYSDGIPLAGDVTTVQAYLDALKPVTADLTVAAPVAVALDFTIDLGATDTAAIRTAVEANLQEMVVRDGEPAGTIYISRINEAISLATGEFDHVLTLPAANVTHTTGQIATMGTITWA